jgi:hypothetical protein
MLMCLFSFLVPYFFTTFYIFKVNYTSLIEIKKISIWKKRKKKCKFQTFRMHDGKAFPHADSHKVKHWIGVNKLKKSQVATRKLETSEILFCNRYTKMLTAEIPGYPAWWSASQSQSLRPGGREQPAVALSPREIHSSPAEVVFMNKFNQRWY